MRITIATASALALVAAASHARTIEVPGDFETITEAIGASEWGDIIDVGPGVYKESLVFAGSKGDGVILRSTAGPESTTIAYGEAGNVNEAVITYQGCSNSTQLLGFTIDGRDLARRGVLVNNQSKPVLANLVIRGSEYGVASHRGSFPYLEGLEVYGSFTASLFVQGGSADARDCVFSDGEKFGVYVRGTLDPMRLRNCLVENNGQVGLQATEGEFTIEGGRYANNGDSGLILQDVSPEVDGIEVIGNPNVGIVMEACWGVVRNCTIRGSDFGMVVSIDGQPEIRNCTFSENTSYHIGVEGDAAPIIGGSLEFANQLLGEPSYTIQSSSSQKVVATHNFFDHPCAPKERFQRTGDGRLIRKPWASGNLLRVFDNCEESRSYHKKWLNGKLDADGNPIGRGGA